MKIPTLRSPEGAAGGARMGWLWVSHRCAGCEQGRSSSCYSTGDERGGDFVERRVCVCVCVCVLAPARSRHGFFRRVRCIRIIWRADRYVVKWCGCMRAEMCVHTLTQRVTLVQWKWKWEVWEKKRGSEEIEEFISTKRTSQQNNVYIACFQGCDSFCLLRENVSLESNGASPSLSTNMCVSLCLCVFSWSSSDTCWSQSGWSINSARVFCACE